MVVIVSRIKIYLRKETYGTCINIEHNTLIQNPIIDNAVEAVA